MEFNFISFYSGHNRWTIYCYWFKFLNRVTRNMFLKLISKCPFCEIHMIRLFALLPICDVVFKNECCIFYFHYLKMVNGTQLAYLVYQCCHSKNLLETIGMHHMNSECNFCVTCVNYIVTQFDFVAFISLK
jgi:hypothetical protein